MLASVSLIKAMHAVASSRCVVIRTPLAAAQGLLSTFRHEGLGGQPVEFGKPCRDLREHRLY